MLNIDFSRVFSNLIKGREAWVRYVKEVKENNPHFDFKDFEIFNFLLDEENENYLDFKNFSTKLIIDQSFYRIRIHENEDVKLYDTIDEIGAPVHIERKFTRAGRVNYAGVVYLYLSNTPIGALAEIDPPIKQKITIGEFKPLKELTIVDLSLINREKIRGFLGQDTAKIVYLNMGVTEKNYNRLVLQNEFYYYLSIELNKPVNQFHDFEYRPSQRIVSEITKIKDDKGNNLYDGIAFKSSKSDSINIVLFNCNEDVELIKSEAWHIVQKYPKLKIDTDLRKNELFKQKRILKDTKKL